MEAQTDAFRFLFPCQFMKYVSMYALHVLPENASTFLSGVNMLGFLQTLGLSKAASARLDELPKINRTSGRRYAVWVAVGVGSIGARDWIMKSVRGAAAVRVIIKFKLMRVYVFIYYRTRRCVS